MCRMPYNSSQRSPPGPPILLLLGTICVCVRSHFSASCACYVSSDMQEQKFLFLRSLLSSFSLVLSLFPCLPRFRSLSFFLYILCRIDLRVHSTGPGTATHGSSHTNRPVHLTHPPIYPPNPPHPLSLPPFSPTPPTHIVVRGHKVGSHTCADMHAIPRTHIRHPEPRTSSQSAAARARTRRRWQQQQQRARAARYSVYLLSGKTVQTLTQKAVLAHELPHRLRGGLEGDAGDEDGNFF